MVFSYETEDSMVAARRVACVLALQKVRGFEEVLGYLDTNRSDDVRLWSERNRMEPPEESSSLPVRVLHTLALIADYYIIPTTARKTASHCGGEEPGEGENRPHPYNADFMHWADPGNACLLYTSPSPRD